MDLTTASPAEIDTVLSDLHSRASRLAQRVLGAEDYIKREVARNLNRGYRGTATWDEVEAYLDNAGDFDSLLRYHRDLVAQRRSLAEVKEQMAPLNAEFKRRGGWTRAFLAVTSKGHIHSSMECSTCYDSTQYYWFTDLSGHDEAEIVTKAGSDACTVCYPSAPVNDLKRPRSIFSDDEKAAQKSRVEREQAKADRLAKKIANGLTADGSEFTVNYVEHNSGGHERDRVTGQSTYVYKDRPRREYFKTEAAAIQWVVRYAIWEKGLHAGDKAPAFAQVIEAVAAKHSKTVEAVTAEVEAKIAAKVKRDNR